MEDKVYDSECSACTVESSDTTEKHVDAPEENKIILYSTHCPMCHQLERQLGAKNIQYEECDDIDKMKAIGISSVPVLFVNGEKLNFTKALRWVKEQEVRA